MAKEKKSEFVELVNSDSRIDLEDLRLVLSAKVEFNTSAWIFVVSIIVTLALALNTLPSTDFGLAAKLSVVVILVIFFLRLRRRDPDEMIRDLLLKTDYLEAKSIIQSRKDQAETQ